MRNLSLQQNESIILQNDSVLHGGGMASYTDELYLTNLNIIYVSKGIFGKVKGIQKFPLNQVKVVNGQAQAILGKSSDNGSPELQIYFSNGQEAFQFQSGGKKEILKWVNNISQILTGTASQAENAKNIMAIPGSEKIFGTVKDTIGAFKDTFGIKGKENQPPENVTSKCIGCRAPLSGVKGTTVRCKYCDTDNTL